MKRRKFKIVKAIRRLKRKLRRKSKRRRRLPKYGASRGGYRL